MTDGRTAADIEREIEETRDRMGREVDAIAARLRPRRFIRDHPATFAAIGVSFALGIALAFYLLQSRHR
jgi:ElaB/YqjD/DUF883 family membrane-anchored ribosome-binding protein